MQLGAVISYKDGTVYNIMPRNSLSLDEVNVRMYVHILIFMLEYTTFSIQAIQNGTKPEQT
jgi:ABC-type uncharacterized transport system permease subunit